MRRRTYRGLATLSKAVLVVLVLPILQGVNIGGSGAERDGVSGAALAADGSGAPPKTALHSLEMGFFEKDYIRSHRFQSATFKGELVDVTTSDEAARHQAALEVEAEGSQSSLRSTPSEPQLGIGDNAAAIRPPDEEAPFRLNPDMPAPWLGMAGAYVEGDIPLAEAYARQFVRYKTRLIFTARDLTTLVTEAMVDEGLLDRDAAVGVVTRYDYNSALMRRATNDPVRPTHEEVLKRIKSDPEHEVEIFYFFTLDCSFCRAMAPDVERLWRSVKGDRRVKMVALTLGAVPVEWVEAYREYTGMTMPIFEGSETAKAFRVAFAPTVVVAAPNGKVAYMKNGEQTFERLYELVRTVQGLPVKRTPEVQRIVESVIGEAEALERGGSATAGYRAVSFRGPASGVEVRPRDALQKF